MQLVGERPPTTDTAHMMRKLKDIMPPGTMPKELDIAIKRLEATEASERIETEMGDVLGDIMGGERGPGGAIGPYSRNLGLYYY